MRASILIRLLLILFAGIGPATPSVPAQAAQPVSAPNRTPATGAGNSYAPVVTTDGRFVAFVSQANNLVTNDDRGPHLDLFLRDLIASNTVLISVSTNGVGGANDNIALYSLSSNAQFIAFETAASNLAPGDSNRHADIYIRDVASGTTALVSVNAAGTDSGNGPSTNPILSEDGRYVIFESVASNLVTNDFNGTNDIFIHDLVAGTTILVSVNIDGTASPTGPSFSPSISANGLFVTFVSRATNLVEGATNRAGEIYIRDVAGRSNLWAMAAHLLGTRSRTPSGQLEPMSASEPILSADGRYVAFKTLRQTVRFDLSRPTNSVRILYPAQNFLQPSALLTFEDNPRLGYSAGLGPLSFSREGRFLAYSSQTNINPHAGIVRMDFETVLTDVTYNTYNGNNDGPGYWWTNRYPVADIIVTNYARSDRHTPSLCLSTNGSRLVFVSNATGLVPSVTNNTFQLYMADVATRVVQLVSTNRTGEPGADAEGILPAISSDGSMVAWDSPDPEVIDADLNHAWDIFARHTINGETHLVSERLPSLPEASERMIASLSPQALSANGKHIAYTVLGAEKGVPGSSPNVAARNLFIRDLSAGTSSLVGANWPVLMNTVTGVITNFDKPANFAEQARLSADGRFVTFVRSTPQLGPNIYRADLQDRSTRIVNELPQGGPYYSTDSPCISSDGQLVAFTAAGYPIYFVSPPVFEGAGSAIVVRDFRVNGISNRVISMDPSGTIGSKGSCIQPQFSPDGRWLSFLSTATNLVAGALPSGTFQIYVRNLEREQTRLVSFLTANEASAIAMSGDATNPVFSADSRFIVISLVSGTSRQVFRHDVEAALDGIRTNDLVCVDCANASSSADGQFIAYQSWPAGGGTSNIVVRDMVSGQSELVSVNRFGGAGGNGSSFTPLISHDARYVVFSSKASDLVPNDSNGAMDVFVRDRLNGVTHCLSRNRDGSSTGNRVSSHPILSADGRTVAFQSFAADLVAGDYNDTRDVFVVTLGGPDTDGDGMDDDWEMAYFNSTSRDGTGDFDSDRADDLAEFRAGTNPSKDASVLRVITLTTFGNQAQRSTAVIWAAIPGHAYRVQFKEGVDDSWADLPGDVLAAGTSASKVHTTHDTVGQHFYRVVVAP